VRVRRCALAAVCVALVSASSAAAEVRTLAVDDPQDAVATVSGTPNSPDISRVEARYDTAGSLTITVHFYNDAASIDRSQNYAFWGTFTVGSVGSQTSCATAAGSIFGQHHVYATSTTFYDRASVSGLDGTLDFTRTTSPDNRTITISASSPSIANRDYRCLSYQLNARRYSTAENIYSRYDEGCGCWYTSSVLDVVGQHGQYDTLGAVFFDGYGPPPPPACSNGIDDDGDGLTDYPNDPGCDNATDTDEASPPPAACADGQDNDGDGLTDLKDPGCRGKKTNTSEADPATRRARFSLRTSTYHCFIDTAVEVLPDIAPARLFPFKKVRITVTGPHYRARRFLPLGTANGYEFRVHRSGRYTVSGLYTGDKWRSRSATKTRHVRVTHC
jgi:hypothetical protein